MMERLLLLSGIAAGCVRGILCLFLISRLLAAKKPGRTSIGVILFGVTVGIVVCNMAGLPDFYGMVWETVLITLCAVCFQGADTRMSLFVGIFYEIGVSFWKFLTASWLGVIFDSSIFLEDDTWYGQIPVWLLYVLLLILMWYVFKHSDLGQKEAFRFASAVSVAGFLAVITLSQQTRLRVDDDTLDMWTILSVVLLMSVLVLRLNRQYEVEKELARLKSQQAELLERDYTALNHAYGINAKLFHDFHNHIGVLRQFLSHGKTNEAMEYLDELRAPVQEMTDTVWTGDETLDYLINSKAVAAKEYGITYQVQVEFPHHTNLQSADLCAIVGNLLDNALEAAKQGNGLKQPWIHLTIRRINQMLVIKAENSFSTVPIEKDGALQTSKKEAGLHGWGLKSVRAAAEKYDGMVQTSYTKDTFRAVVTLSYQGMPISSIR